MGFLDSIYSKQWVVFGTILVPLLFFVTLCALRDTPASTTSSSSYNALAFRDIPNDSKVSPLPLEVGTTLARYASSKVTPQQTFEEMMLTVRVLAKRGPCNFLVFGLGYDSPLWRSLNHGGRTVFLVNYNTKLADSDGLMKHARKNRHGICRPVQDIQNSKCKIALSYLPEKLYQVTWDVIMVDAPRGYFPAAPGRMSAIFSAAVMAKSRKNGTTDIYVHDVDRPVERLYCDEFLCKGNLVEEAPTKRLRHYRLHPKGSEQVDFC